MGPMMSHYVLDFLSTRHRLQHAVCGALVNTMHHSPLQTCPQCEAWLQADDHEAAALTAKWEAEEAVKRGAIR